MAISRPLPALAFIALSGALCGGEERVIDSDQLAREARPLLSENCFQCHGPAEQKGDLRLDRPNPAVVPGKPEESELITRIHASDPDEVMPPPDSHKSLSATDKKLLEDWITSGANYVSHWSFEPIRDAGLRIDDVLTDRQKEAPPGRLIRRLALDLTGLPPTIEEVEQFEAGKITYSELVDRYLASPHYGENRARSWLDAARYSDTHGLQNDYFRAIWPYRQWVIEAFNANLPFDEFSIRQLAGDLLPGDQQDPVATGFLKCNASTHEGGVIREEYRIKYLLDRTDTVATTWLGLTAGCASCHDHKFDPITMEDYYGLTAFFAAIDEPVMNGDRAYNGPIVHLPIGPDQAEREALRQWAAKPAFSPSVHLDVFGQANQATLDGKAPGQQTLSMWLPAGAQGTLLSQTSGRGDNRHGFELLLEADRHLVLRLLGKNKEGKPGKRDHRTTVPLTFSGPAHLALTLDHKSGNFTLSHTGVPLTLSVAHDDLIEPLFAEKPGGEALLGQTSHLPVAPRFLTLSRYDRLLSPEEIRSLAMLPAKVAEAMAKITGVACTLVVREGAPVPSHILKGGLYEAKGAEVSAATPAALPPMPDSLPRNRLGFARWLFQPDNPLTARVAVNRIWAQFFGEGFCKTQNDLGNQGSFPRHPELFDSLAADFQKDWDIKRLIRRLVLSEAYRQSSVVASGKTRAHRQRLDGEVLRDQALAIGGLLERRLGGPPVSPYQPAGLWQAVSVEISDSREYRQGSGSDLYRRSIYTIHKRTAGPPIMSNFDAPSREVCSVQREVTNTPLQSLQLMNDVQFLEAARGLAVRAMKHPDPVARMFKLATCRDPEREERRVLEELLTEFAAADTELLSRLGQFPEKAPGPYVMLATTLLNLDEVLCR